MLKVDIHSFKKHILGVWYIILGSENVVGMWGSCFLLVGETDSNTGTSRHTCTHSKSEDKDLLRPWDHAQWRRGAFTPPEVLQHQLSVLQPAPVPLHLPGKDQIPRVQGSVHKTALAALPLEVPVASLWFRSPVILKSSTLEVSMTPSLGPLSLLQQLMGLKRRPVYYKREQLRRARWKRCTGQGGGRAQSFYALLRCNTLPRFPHV